MTVKWTGNYARRSVPPEHKLLWQYLVPYHFDHANQSVDKCVIESVSLEVYGMYYLDGTSQRLIRSYLLAR